MTMICLKPQGYTPPIPSHSSRVPLLQRGLFVPCRIKSQRFVVHKNIFCLLAANVDCLALGGGEHLPKTANLPKRFPKYACKRRGYSTVNHSEDSFKLTGRSATSMSFLYQTECQRGR